jgi:hypothetical protein
MILDKIKTCVQLMLFKKMIKMHLVWEVAMNGSKQLRIINQSQLILILALIRPHLLNQTLHSVL